jgi:hypothetical protein
MHEAVLQADLEWECMNLECIRAMSNNLIRIQSIELKLQL